MIVLFLDLCGIGDALNGIQQQKKKSVKDDRPEKKVTTEISYGSESERFVVHFPTSESRRGTAQRT